MQLEEEDLEIERLFLNGIFYRNNSSNYDYDTLLNEKRLYNHQMYYKKIYDTISFIYFAFSYDTIDFVEAASDFAMLITSNQIFSRRNDYFHSYFYYFGFAMVEFKIEYSKFVRLLKKRIKYKHVKSIKNLLDNCFNGRLLKNKYEISDNAKKVLEKRFGTFRDDINKAYLDCRYHYNTVYKFPSEISAVYHYRKHGVMKGLEPNSAIKVIDIKTYIEKAHRIINDPSTGTNNPLVFKSGREKVVLSNNNQYIISYIR